MPLVVPDQCSLPLGRTHWSGTTSGTQDSAEIREESQLIPVYLCLREHVLSDLRAEIDEVVLASRYIPKDGDVHGTVCDGFTRPGSDVLVDQIEYAKDDAGASR